MAPIWLGGLDLRVQLAVVAFARCSTQEKSAGENHLMARNRSRFHARQRVGKYRIRRRLAEGGFAEVYQAEDTIEGVEVALKVPHETLIDESNLAVFRKEARLAARLDHPNILPIKNAGFVDDVFLIAYPLGTGTLGDRLRHRMSFQVALDYSGQILDGLACAHAKRIAHCDVKPDNFILFPGNRLRLADFGIARIIAGTMTASGSGTVGYLAPEQALGKPTLQSDVFCAGLILYRLFARRLPEWPFEWPFEGADRLRNQVHPDLIALLQRALQVDQRKRFSSAVEMQRAFQRIRPRALKPLSRRRRPASHVGASSWRILRFGEFKREYGRVLELRLQCLNCHGPVSEFMRFCPWCARSRSPKQDETVFPDRCERCHRGVKRDWSFCPHCYGAKRKGVSSRRYTDARYCAQCGHCHGKLMPFLKYCPWCRRKVIRPWKVPGVKDSCLRCRWGVVLEFWDSCPWCASSLRREAKR